MGDSACPGEATILFDAGTTFFLVVIQNWEKNSIPSGFFFDLIINLQTVKSSST